MKPFSIISAAMALLSVIMSAPAHAGKWEISYWETGTATATTSSGTVVTTVSPPGVSGVTGCWFPASGGGMATVYAYPGIPATASADATVHASATWAPDFDGEACPANVTFVEYSLAVIQVSNADAPTIDPSSTKLTGSLQDGLGDSTTSWSDGSEFAFGKSNTGYRIKTVSFPPGGEPPTVYFTAILHGNLSVEPLSTHSNEAMLFGLYSVSVVNSDLQAWSTHCAPSLGGSDPGWNAHAPRYFSGTGCEIDALVLPLSGMLQSAILAIGGTVVRSYPTDLDYQSSTVNYTANNPLKMSVLFDSTHFSDSAQVPVTLTVTDTAGNQYTEAVQACARNRGYVNSNDTQLYVLWQDLPQAVMDDLAGINYSCPAVSSDRRSTELSTLPIETVFYTMTHGGPYCFGDAQAVPDSPVDQYYLNFDDVKSRISGKNRNQPPYNFAYIDGCYTATYDDGAIAFGVMDNGLDRAFLGYQDEMATGLNDDWTQLVWADLSLGYTLSYSISDAVSSFGIPIGIYGKSLPGHPCYLPKVWGDADLQIHGVYGITPSYAISSPGSSASMVDIWFKHL